ncbi:Trafficking particle complex subunit 5 [Micractinium conductrix]|uniref:Trafficking protein particle complex subunit n=1 Tax=Micractinium conductrix TaxID=554055 RepID=A0A2P6V838_9CHLO|nr:Trafficking particle complex subunit 5 [Micractinium conductrix]|eukprot:PSC70249.1 Trafficking particle complex subunit 5 [Micractinium conductrix]
MFQSRGSVGIVDKPLRPGRQEVPLSTFAYLFSELVQYCQSRVSNISELERKLDEVGYGVGLRLLEVLCYRERGQRRETRLLDMLKFVHSTLWRYLFGRQARDLEQSNTAEDEYMISDMDLPFTKFVSVPREMGHLNPAAFVAGIVRGALDGAGFSARVTAHYVPVPGQPRPKTVILMKFAPAVMQREARMPGS